MNKLLIGSHIDLLVYDPCFLNSISEKNSDKLFIFIPKTNKVDKKETLNKIIKKFKLNIFYIPNVESDINQCKELFLYFKDFIIKKKIKHIFCCNPTRLHCYISYLVSISLKTNFKFYYYQGSGYPSHGVRDQKIFSILSKSNSLNFLIKTKLVFRISRLIDILKKNKEILRLIFICLKTIPYNRIQQIKIIPKIILNQGVPIDSLIAHDRVGLNSLLIDVPKWHNKNLKADSFLLNQGNFFSKKKSSSYQKLYLLPSLLLDKGQSKKQFYLALDTWIELVNFIKFHKPDLKIYAKLHPRSIVAFEKEIITILKNKGVEILPKYLTPDEFLNKNSLLITDVSAVLSYCQLNKIKAISYQTEATCGYFFYNYKLPSYTTESMIIINQKESILNLIN